MLENNGIASAWPDAKSACRGPKSPPRGKDVLEENPGGSAGRLSFKEFRGVATENSLGLEEKEWL